VARRAARHPDHRALIGGLTALVLIVAATNLGNLVMSRGTGRVRELGVRMALGARRTRVVRQLVIESVPLVALGGLGSLGFAWATVTLLAALGGFPPYLDFRIDWRTVVVAVALGGVALVVVGLLPAWKVAQQHRCVGSRSTCHTPIRWRLERRWPFSPARERWRRCGPRTWCSGAIPSTRCGMLRVLVPGLERSPTRQGRSRAGRHERLM
jgi:hypothetical protein